MDPNDRAQRRRRLLRVVYDAAGGSTQEIVATAKAAEGIEKRDADEDFDTLTANGLLTYVIKGGVSLTSDDVRAVESDSNDI